MLQEKPEVIAIIPARGGSKGLPRKNIKDLCGKPLIAYSIEVALKAQLIDRVIVSTEDDEIAEVARSYGAQVPFLRPPDLADDRANIGEAINFTINRLKQEGLNSNIIVQLYPTHPFRTPNLMDHLVKKLLAGYASVTTVKAMRHRHYTFFPPGTDRLRPLIPTAICAEDRNLQTYFRPYGLFVGFNYHFSFRHYRHIIDNPASLIDIDTYEDFMLAEEVVKQGLFDFEAGYLGWS